MLQFVYLIASLIAPASWPQGAVRTTHPSGGIPDRTWGSSFSYDCVPSPERRGGCKPVEIAMAGGPGLTWSIAAGKLPEGVQLLPDGTFRGFPHSTGEYAVAIESVDSNGDRSRAQFTFRVRPLRKASSSTGGVGVPYANRPLCSGSRALTLSAVKGELPPGLTYRAEEVPLLGAPEYMVWEGTLSGVPTRAGNFRHVGRCASADGTFVDSWEMTIRIEP